MRRLVLLRPEPGLSASTARAEALGIRVVAHPLFAIEAIETTPPPGPFDGLVLTSANAVRHGGSTLDALKTLETYAVGDATACAARDAGLDVVAVGQGGVEGLHLPDGHFVHLCGERHRALPGDVVAVPVYRTVVTDPPIGDLRGAVVAVHSPASGERLAALAPDRTDVIVAAISEAAARACGDGWQRVEWAERPDDDSLLALAAALCQSGDV